MICMEKNTAIAAAIDLLGGPTAAAKQLGATSYQTVQQWRETGSVPPRYCPAIEELLNGAVTRRDLRPDDWQDIWPELVTKSRRRSTKERAGA